MYDRSLWTQLTDALKDARSGDANKLMRLADAYAQRTPGGQYQTNIMESIYTVNCLDKADTSTLAQTEAFAQKLSREAPTWGRYPRTGQRSVHRVAGTGDRQEPDRRTELAAHRHRRDDRDPATPYEWATRLRQQLAHGVLITRDGDGHRLAGRAPRPSTARWTGGSSTAPSPRTA